MPARNRFAELLPEIIAWRRDFHENPELMFEVHRTAGLVAERLRAFGCDEVVEGIGRTGVVGVIRGRSDSAGRVVGLRADMDALPIIEATGAPHASKVPGRMHACGHDGHSAMLLGAAKYLAETRNFDGTAVVIFQPAEEGGGGGRVMCEDGLMDRWGIQEVYGMHNWPGLPVGRFAIRPGPFFAATDQFGIEITGRGGHAAKPHEVVDPTVAGAQLVLALQTIASRNVDPLKSLVVSVTAFRTESEAFNVIPQTVRLRGTIRTLEADVRALAEARLHAIAEHTAAAFGAAAKVDFHRGYPVMANHAAETRHAAAVAAEVSGVPVEEAPPVMGGEDFAYMLEARPGAYILMGNCDTAGVHHPAYDFNDEAIPAGCSWFAGMVEARMPAA
ncbi:M20 aminoacylase family protein [Ruixingdingia sedimenti]|uniref:M20 aminoacylase family protein n=1 Tax=Ruixingdingia sedimenti TaxID=3073604 RepID=A0ABU1F320_9RHOB|nr:M20 aminoacylase family protein [Xinfangfangia sp. LG-4]MDR5651266.1 M20 aminoacylase family protein [Xinfangfangia sp. LG-4]